MKIGIIVDKFPSVSETFILNKVEGLCKRGYNVVVFRNSRHNDPALEAQMLSANKANLTLVDMQLPTNPIQATGTLLRNPSVAVSALSSGSSSLAGKIVSAIRDKYFATNPCDIYHFEFSGLAIQYLPLFKNLRGKIVVSCRGTAEKVKAVTQPSRKMELQQLFAKVDKVHCVSEDMAQTVVGIGAPRQKVFVNRPAIISSFFKPAETKASRTSVNIFSIGRFSFQKGYLLGLLAMQQVVKQDKDVHWTIAGDGPMREEIQFYIHDLGLQDHVTLAGAVVKQQVLALFQNADIFFLPSVYEGIANVVLEAMAMQLPVVSSDCSGMKEVITQNEDGMLFPNYDVNAMAASLLDLIADKEKRKRLGIEARKTIQAHFDLERQLDVFEREYQQLLTPVTA
ncbi:glycosyltransferase family 4 protein [Aridibaculum aurantiacum]|uniref:glycosyltransferase family 4 protein n=1 Tax=Aridibaculum aurantiacum TaxID=2810307 RepID=UPI001A965210|nr:glycosyltransferase family 4 protein [Aridibaculum aurantiacum]